MGAKTQMELVKGHSARDYHVGYMMQAGLGYLQACTSSRLLNRASGIARQIIQWMTN